MAYERPDIFIEEILTAENVPVGASSSVASFMGITQRGPTNKPILVTNFDEFKRVFGSVPSAGESIFYSVRSFFENGGASAYIVRLKSAATPTIASVTIQNEATSPSDLLTFEAGYRNDVSPGTAGNDLSIDINRSSNVATLSLSSAASAGDLSIKVDQVSGLLIGSTLKLADGSNTEFKIVKDISSAIVSSAIEHTLTLESALSNAFATSNTTIKVEEYDVIVKEGELELERFERLSLNPDNDLYIETVINDTETGSRLIRVDDLKTSLVDKEVNSTSLTATKLDLTGGTSELTAFAVSDVIGVQSSRTGLYALDAREQINLICVPPSLTGGVINSTMLPIVQQAMLAYCAGRLNTFAILDAPAGKTALSSGAGSIGAYRDADLGVDSFWGALYFPHMVALDNTGKGKVTIPPSGAVAGLYSRVDQLPAPQGSVSTSPAGYGEFGLIRGILGLEVNTSDAEHGPLNVKGINCLRRVNRADGDQAGTLVLGARTLSSSDDFRYINVRRLMIFIERQVKELAKPFLFKNNSIKLRSDMTRVIESFLSNMFRSGQLAGASTSEAFFVKIDDSNNTPDMARQGILVGEIGIAALRPAEFIVFKFSQTQAGVTVQE